MTAQRPVKARKPSAALVGVIASPSDLRRAARLRRPPDFFELRLDALHPISSALEHALAQLRRPLILSARHSREGGHSHLSAKVRRDLLQRFLPHAAFVDVELRSAPAFRALLENANALRIHRILSVHILERTPSLRTLEQLARRAEKFAPDLLKIVTRTEEPEELERLLAFFDRAHRRLPLCAMGIGRLGGLSRRLLARRGAPFLYVHLDHPLVPGQLSLTAARRLRPGAA